jgi:ERCC4-type nuclease
MTHGVRPPWPFPALNVGPTGVADVKKDPHYMAFRIVIDTREQLPYGFQCETVRAKLNAGDYSVEGWENKIAVERKSLKDFVGTVIHDRQRFNVELAKLQSYDFACIAVEADLDQLLRGQYPADLRAVSQWSILGAALEIAIRYKIPVYWCGSRQAAGAFTEKYLRMCVRVGGGAE